MIGTAKVFVSRWSCLRRCWRCRAMMQKASLRLRLCLRLSLSLSLTLTLTLTLTPTLTLGEAEAEARPADPLLTELARFAALTSRTEIGNELVCMPALVAQGDQRLGDCTAEACLDGKCKCGFQRLWSKKNENSLRAKIVQKGSDGSESLQDGAPLLWGQKMSWDTVKPGGDSNGDSAEDSDLRHTVFGTVWEFLDACEEVHRGWLPHRWHGVQSKKAEKECDQNLTPGKLKNDSDWSENGEIVVKHQMQSEYWSIKYYSLLISITSFLISSAWVDRKSPLEAGAEVTVQPEDALIYGIQYVRGSYFAVVVEGSAAAGRDIAYVVKRPDGSTATLSRHRLRHRVWHRVAFLGITNEKQHVAVTTQAFFSRQLEFWRIWNDEGRTAALAFAANDRAALAPATLAAAEAAAAAAHVVDAAHDAADGDDGEDGVADPDAAIAAAVAAAAAAATARPSDAATTAAAASAGALASAAAIVASDPKFAQFLAELDVETFLHWLGHADNATHFKSSRNLHWWSNQQDTLGFLRSIWQQFGCPGKGKGPWDGLGAVVKTKVCPPRTPSPPRDFAVTPSPPHLSRCAMTSPTSGASRLAGASARRSRWRSTSAAPSRARSGWQSTST